MRATLILIGILFVGAGSLGMSLAPDPLSLLIIGIMCLLMLAGFVLGIMPVALINAGFRRGSDNINKALDVNSESKWLAVNQMDSFFNQKILDHWFLEYREKVKNQQEQGMIISDIETVFNEESLALRCWHSVISQIPGTLTALGLLGTFIGLITGINDIGFSTVDATIASVTTLLAGIRIAFYTSIMGVIMSIVFNITYKFLWNGMLRSLGLFTEDFHRRVQPDAEEQLLLRQQNQMQMILERLERIPKKRGFSNAQMEIGLPMAGSEFNLMSEIRRGYREGEFTFWLQPVCNLVNRQIIGGEALIRWHHKEMGVIPPAEFVPVVEQNGFIVKLDQLIWEAVCRTIRKWIDQGIRPMPISVNISKKDILCIDVASFFENMVREYRIPPRNLSIEIDQSAYEYYTDAVIDAETRLRQCGLKVVVDGFDGGLVAMNALKESNADLLKIDLRFVEKNIDLEPYLRLVLEQARKLKRSVAVAGIENTEQLHIVQKSGCVEGQGYYLYMPMAEDEFETMIQGEA